jgi:uncharacterized protein
MPSKHINPSRNSLVFDLRSLSRQAGSSRAETRIALAPADVRLELVGVPEGSDVELNLKFEAVTEGVLVSGSASAQVTGECARCLGPVSDTVTVSLLELYRYHEDPRRTSKHKKTEDEESADDEEDRFLDGDLLDLEPAFRDAVVLALPMSPLCREDCPGLCVQCGLPLADAGPGHTHDDRPDPRWAGLAELHDEQDEQDKPEPKLEPKEG